MLHICTGLVGEEADGDAVCNYERAWRHRDGECSGEYKLTGEANGQFREERLGPRAWLLLEGVTLLYLKGVEGCFIWESEIRLKQELRQEWELAERTGF